MSHRIVVASLLWALLCAAPAQADKVHMKGGGVLEGDVTRTAGGYRVRLASGGEVTVSAADVERVEAVATAHEEYAARLSGLDPTDADAHYMLGLFCQEKGLKQEAESCFRAAVAIVPDHERARAALGEVKWQGRWTPQEEALSAQGLVKHEGHWMTPAERDAHVREARADALRLSIAQLARKARAMDPQISDPAAGAIARIDDPLAIPPLVEQTRATSPTVRVAVARALAHFSRDERAIAELARLSSHDPDDGARDAEIDAVAAARIADVGDLLIREYARSPDPAARRSAAYALGRMRYKPAFLPLDATLFFRVQREEVVPSHVEPGNGLVTWDGPGRPIVMIPSGMVTTLQYRVVDEIAFNDAARRSLQALTGRDFDFDRGAWEKWWRESEASFDLWMQPLKPASGGK